MLGGVSIVQVGVSEGVGSLQDTLQVGIRSARLSKHERTGSRRRTSRFCDRIFEAVLVCALLLREDEKQSSVRVNMFGVAERNANVDKVVRDYVCAARLGRGQ